MQALCIFFLSSQVRAIGAINENALLFTILCSICDVHDTRKLFCIFLSQQPTCTNWHSLPCSRAFPDHRAAHVGPVLEVVCMILGLLCGFVLVSYFLFSPSNCSGFFVYGSHDILSAMGSFFALGISDTRNPDFWRHTRNTSICYGDVTMNTVTTRSRFETPTLASAV